MKLWHLILGISLIVSVVIAIILLSFQRSQKSPTTDIRYLSSEILSTTFAYDQNLFLKTVSVKPDVNSEKSRVIVLPHHLLASPLIYKGILSLDIKDSKSTIIILSPNHSNASNCPISYTSSSWSTPYGDIKVNQNIQNKISNQKEICEDNNAFKSEHGVATILPYLKFQYPDIDIVPLIFNKNIPLSALDALSTKISEVLKEENVFLVSSLDFSHNLTSNQSVIKDAETKSFIKSRDYSKLNSLGPDYLDSPPVLITTLQVADKASLAESEIDHQNSSFYNQDPSLVTSYFLFGYSKINDNVTTLLFGGDVMLARSVNTQMKKRNNYSWPVEKIKSFTSKADLFMVNLESPFGVSCRPTDTGMVFCADPQSIKSLTDSGVDVVTIANNHIFNQGEEGFVETVSILNKNNITSVGAPLAGAQQNIITIKNIKIGILGFNDIPPYPKNINKLTEDNLVNQIKLLRPQVDILIVTPHWGNEYSMRSLRQQTLAHMAIDSGADAVIGHHPHWVQENEDYKGKPIYYSLGNLIFDQMWSEETKKGLMVQLTYQGKNLLKQEKFPIKIQDYGQPAIDGQPVFTN
jgi:poly-gamma-glutamate synthesis protein (capsule biosynthesis protein)